MSLMSANFCIQAGLLIVCNDKDWFVCVLQAFSNSLIQIITRVNPFMWNVFSHPYQLDKSILNFRLVGWYFSIFIQFLKETSVS